ncbi:hypothetical protein FACS189431_2600 [Alphaproteobacteria bacterium]|nr:hypothetical protein FACS189431_2600 [Alphaproteobacteria bacterium]
MKQVLVSIIIPVYNSEKYLGECLDSVLEQTLGEIEIICVDDGSTDKSLQILEEYAKQDGRVKILKQKNSGPGPARNRAMKAARGEFLAFMDSDDFYPDDAVLEKLYAVAKKHNVKIAGGSLAKYYVNTGETKISFSDSKTLEKQLTFQETASVNYRSYQSDFGYTRFIYSRQFLVDNKISFPNLVRFEDPVFFVQAMVRAEKFATIPDVVYVYRVEHKKHNLTISEVRDNLLGGGICLDIAKENKLDALYKNIIERLCYTVHWEVRYRIPTIEYVKLLLDFQQCLPTDSEVLQRQKDKFTKALTDTFFSDYRQLDIDHKRLYDKNERLVTENQNLRHDNELIRATHAMRVGRIIVWPAHQLKRLAKNIGVLR